MQNFSVNKDLFRIRLAERKLVTAHGDLDRIAQRSHLAHENLSASGDAHVHDAATGRALALDPTHGNGRAAGRVPQIAHFLRFPLQTIIRDAIFCEIATRVSFTETIRLPARDETTETVAPSTKPRFCKNCLV